jgi:hypothetical protein
MAHHCGLFQCDEIWKSAESSEKKVGKPDAIVKRYIKLTFIPACDTVSISSTMRKSES